MIRILIGFGVVYAAFRLGKVVAEAPNKVEPLLLPPPLVDREALARQAMTWT